MNLERLIITKLSLVCPRMVTETVLWSDLRIDDPTVSLTAMRAAIRSLETKGQVAVVPGEDSTKIKITADGIARLAE